MHGVSACKRKLTWCCWKAQGAEAQGAQGDRVLDWVLGPGLGPEEWQVVPFASGLHLLPGLCIAAVAAPLEVLWVDAGLVPHTPGIVLNLTVFTGRLAL